MACSGVVMGAEREEWGDLRQATVHFMTSLKGGRLADPLVCSQKLPTTEVTRRVTDASTKRVVCDTTTVTNHWQLQYKSDDSLCGSESIMILAFGFIGEHDPIDPHSILIPLIFVSTCTVGR